MAEIGALHAALSADTAQFDANMKKARDIVRTNATGMERAMHRVRNAFNTAMQGMKIMATAAVAGGAALAYMVKGAIDAADKIGKMSQSLGVSTETLSALKYAAELSGVSFEALGNSLKITAQRAADAARGTGEARHAYEALGIEVLDANGTLKSSDEIMKEVADRFKGMEDGAGKTALAVQLFGRAGADLIPLLNQGRDGIEAMTDEAHKLGITYDEETTKAAERFKDNLTRLSKVKEGMVNQITKSVLPTLEKYADRTVAAATETDAFAKAGETANTALKLLISTGTLLWAILDGVGTAIGGMAAALVALVKGQFREAWSIAGDVTVDFRDRAKQAMDDVVAIWHEGADGLERDAPKLGDKIAAPVVVAADKAEAAAQKMGEAIDRQITSLKVQADTFGVAEIAATLYRMSLAGATVEQLALAQAILTTIDGQKKQTAQQTRAKQIFDATRTTQEQFRAQVEELNELYREGAIDVDTYWRAIEKAYDGISEKTDDVKKGFDSLKNTIEGWGRDSAAAVADFAMSGKASFSDMINSMIRDILRMMIYRQVMEPLFGAIGGGLSGIFGGGRATGGPVASGKMYEVNERGPELLNVGGRQFLMMGQQGGNVSPMGDAGGGTTEVKVEVFNESGQAVRARNATATFDTKRMVVGIILEGIEDNTLGLRRALGGS